MNWCQYILFRLFLFSCSDVQENTDISLTRINMSIKKSADNGKTWSETVTIAGEGTTVGCGDPAIVLDKRTGHLLCIFASGN